MTDCRAFAQRYLAVERSLSPERVVDELYCDDAVLEVAGGPIVGRGALLALYRQIFTGVVRVDLELGRVTGTGDVVAFEWRSAAHLADGTVVTGEGCDVVTLRDGRVARNTVYAKP